MKTALQVVAHALLLGLSGALYANPQIAAIPGARANMEILAARSFQSEEFPYAHQVTVALPASYHAQPDRRYPVLWVLDAPLILRSVIGILDTLVLGNQAPEMIVVGIGSPPEEGLRGVGRRVIDFSPPGDGYAPAGVAGKRWSELVPMPEFPHKADAFLRLLVDQIRPELAAEYRFANPHTLLGHSAGGMFAAYSLFQRPEAFPQMIIGSPYLDGVRGAVFAAEEQYAGRHDDLKVRLFMGVGERESADYFLLISGIVDSTSRLTRTLTARHYPSLEMLSRTFAAKDHYTVLPEVIIEGIAFLWQDEIAELPSSWPVRPAAKD